MQAPNWAPQILVEWFSYYEKELNLNGTVLPAHEEIPNLIEMWRRLLTRPEMELIWHFIVSRHCNISLIANGGILGTINRDVSHYAKSRKVSPTHYKEEMNEIATLAATLARKIQNYSCDPSESFNPHNPFYFDAFLTNNDLRRLETILSSENVGEYELTGTRFSGGALREHLPPIEKILERLSYIAK